MTNISIENKWNEKLTLLSVVGIILVIISIMLLKGNSNLNEKRNIKGILIGIVVLVTSGGVMIVQKIMGIFFPHIISPETEFCFGA